MCTCAHGTLLGHPNLNRVLVETTNLKLWMCFIINRCKSCFSFQSLLVAVGYRSNGQDPHPFLLVFLFGAHDVIASTSSSSCAMPCPCCDHHPSCSGGLYRVRIHPPPPLNANPFCLDAPTASTAYLGSFAASAPLPSLPPSKPAGELPRNFFYSQTWR